MSTIDIVCPRCGARAAVTTRPTADARDLCWPRHVVCTTCLSTFTWSARAHAICPVDPLLRLPLARTAQCCGRHTRWAHTEAHRTLLRGYLSAKLREPGNHLPAWLKHDDTLHVIARLHPTP